MTSGTPSNCPFCSRPQSPENLVYEDGYWLVRHSTETNILGYFVIEAKRHIVDLAQANDAEAGSYGKVLRAVMQAIRETSDCQRVYTFSLGEMVEHFHVHVVPRTESVPRSYRGRGILSYPTQPPADAALAAEISERVARRMERLLTLRV